MEDPLIRVPALQSAQEPKPNIRLDHVGEGSDVGILK